MYEYINGLLSEVSPTEAIVETGGIGYKLMISLTTYSELQGKSGNIVKLYLHHIMKEDDEALYGFAGKDERVIFQNLISVSGIGPGSARMILSAMNGEEVRTAILSSDTNKFKSVKGIGLKTAQRLILELKDKIGRASESSSGVSFGADSFGTVRDEAMSALFLLGFSKPAVEKAVTTILKENPGSTLEDTIKKALKML